MNAKANNVLTLDEQIAALLAMKATQDKLNEVIGADLAAIREADKAAVIAKNHADEGTTHKGNIWTHVRNIAFAVYDATVDAPDTRFQVFTDVMGEFLNPKGGDGAEKVKMTTAGQYASTGRKFLTGLLSVEGVDPEKYLNATVREVREAFKDVKVQARNDANAELGKKLRFAAKHGTVEEYDALHVAVTAAVDALFNPIKARKDKSTKKAEADREIRDLQQQQPAEPAVVDVVANVIGEVNEEAADDNQKQMAV